MPRFPGCENLDISNEEKDKCANEKMLKYVYSNLKYPEKAKQDHTEGTCVIQYTVNINGELTDIILARDIGNGCGEEALRVIKSMNNMESKWIPAKQNGMTTSVIYTFPVKFKL